MACSYEISALDGDVKLVSECYKYIIQAVVERSQ